MTAPMPSNEARRLKAVRALNLLDSAPEPQFDEIVRAAGEAFEAQIAVITLVDDNRQWFKAKIGVDFCETERDIAFCSYAIVQSEPLVLLNATLDRRFADSPMVNGPPFVRFYAGAPLILPSGEAIGSLCLADPEPRYRFGPEKIDLLKFFAGVTLERLIRRAQAGRAA